MGITDTSTIIKCMRRQPTTTNTHKSPKKAEEKRIFLWSLNSAAYLAIQIAGQTGRKSTHLIRNAKHRRSAEPKRKQMPFMHCVRACEFVNTVAHLGTSGDPVGQSQYKCERRAQIDDRRTRHSVHRVYGDHPSGHKISGLRSGVCVCWVSKAEHNLLSAYKSAMHIPIGGTPPIIARASVRC